MAPISPVKGSAGLHMEDGLSLEVKGGNSS